MRLLLAALIACVVVPVALLGYAAWTVNRDLHLQAERKINFKLDVLTQHTLRVLQTAGLAQDAMRLLTDGLTDAEIRAREPTLHAAFQDLADGLPSVQSIWVFDADGVPLVSSLPGPVPTINASDRDYFQTLKQRDIGTFIGGVRAPKIAGPLFFSVSRRRPSVDGAFKGVITVSLLPTDFELFYSQLDPGHTDSYAMVRTDGTILARFPGHVTPTLTLRPEESPLIRAMQAHPFGGGFTAPWTVDQIDRLTRYRLLPGWPIVLAAGVKTSTIWSDWRQALASHVAFGLPATLLLVLTLLLAIHRTQQLYVESERRRVAERALSHRQRLEAIGQLTGGVAHDFNNLLTIIRGSAERLRRREKDPRDVRSLDIIERAVQRGATLTRQLLTFSSRQAVAVEVIDLSRHLARFSEVLRRSLRGDIETDFVLPPGPCVVKVDPGELELALLNIAVNARDAMPGGGRLSIRVQTVELDGGPATDSLSGRFACLSLTDTGAGIEAADLARVFEPFFTTKETGKGSGLGLSQVYGFARQSGGTATIVSTPGRGTRVALYMPLTTETPGVIEGRDETTDRAGTGQRILVVEDTSDVAEVMRGLLADVGFRVEVARNAPEAIGILSRGERFDLMMSDVVMPGEMKGLELAREVRRRHPEMPVVLTSGDGASAEPALRDGFVFIEKPYDVAKLREIIELATQDGGGRSD